MSKSMIAAMQFMSLARHPWAILMQSARTEIARQSLTGTVIGLPPALPNVTPWFVRRFWVFGLDNRFPATVRRHPAMRRSSQKCLMEVYRIGCAIVARKPLAGCNPCATPASVPGAHQTMCCR